MQRDENEDEFTVADLASGMAAAPHDELTLQITPNGILIAVCDGMGGHDNGALAAQIATDTLVAAMSTMLNVIAATPEECLCEALRAANGQVYKESGQEFGQIGMGTTCTAGLLLPDRLVLAQVGDSRAYLYRDSSLLQLTKDQSLVAAMVAASTLTSEEARSHPGANIILQALGASADIAPVTSQIQTVAGDMILVETDGLHGQVADLEMSGILSMTAGPADGARSLIDAALLAGGSDNVTVVLARIG